MDEARFSPSEDRKSSDIEARGIDNTPIVAKTTFPIENWHVKPIVVGPETGGPHNRTDLAAGEI